MFMTFFNFFSSGPWIRILDIFFGSGSRSLTQRCSSMLKNINLLSSERWWGGGGGARSSPRKVQKTKLVPTFFLIFTHFSLYLCLRRMGSGGPGWGRTRVIQPREAGYGHRTLTHGKAHPASQNIIPFTQIIYFIIVYRQCCRAKTVLFLELSRLKPLSNGKGLTFSF